MSRSPALPASALEDAGAVVTDVSLKLTNPTELSWGAYVELGRFLGTLGSAYPFWVGDFLLYGEDLFGEEYAQIEAMLPHSPQTLLNYRSIAKHVPPTRRRKTLGFSVHAEVAYLEPRERDAWLDRAEREGWKREDLRAALRPQRELEPVAPVAPDVVDVEPTHRCPACGHTWKEDG